MNAVIYARCASHDLNGQSVQSQLRACSEYANRFGMTVLPVEAMPWRPVSRA